MRKKEMFENLSAPLQLLSLKLDHKGSLAMRIPFCKISGWIAFGE